MSNRKSRSGFTLIELMLVIMIIGITSAITAPYLVKSIRGNRLRTATRGIIAAGRYARSMAVMRQRPMLLSLNPVSGKIEIHEGAAPYAPPDLTVPSATAAENAEEDEPSVISPGAAQLSWSLDGVKLVDIEIDGSDIYSGEPFTVVYARNGRCRPYTLRLADEHRNYSVIEVDAVAGARAEMGRL